MRLIIFIVALFFVSIPTVFAADGLVACDGVASEGVECNFCTLMATIHRVVNYLIVLLILLATIMLAVTGIQLAAMAAGGTDVRGKLKERMLNIMIGFVLIIASWAIVDVVIKVLVTDSQILQWQDILRTPTADLCGDQVQPSNVTPGAANDSRYGENSGYQGVIGQ